MSGSTTLEADQVAVTFDEEYGYQVMIPWAVSGDIAEGAVVLVATAMRLISDDAFYDEMLEWLEDGEESSIH